MKLFHELISEYAAKFPEKSAVTDPFGQLSYRDLDSRSFSVVSSLASLGVGAGDAVAVYVPYVKEFLLGAVSVFKSGGIFVPFDFEYPAERLEYILKDSEAKAVLTFREFWQKKKLAFPEEKVITNIQKYGNISAASIPSAITEAIESGKIKLPCSVLVCAFGAGMTMATAILTLRDHLK